MYLQKSLKVFMAFISSAFILKPKIFSTITTMSTKSRLSMPRSSFSVASGVIFSSSISNSSMRNSFTFSSISVIDVIMNYALLIMNY